VGHVSEVLITEDISRCLYSLHDFDVEMRVRRENLPICATTLVMPSTPLVCVATHPECETHLADKDYPAVDGHASPLPRTVGDRFGAQSKLLFVNRLTPLEHALRRIELDAFSFRYEPNGGTAWKRALAVAGGADIALEILA
jgi:hypothetical protein